VELDFERAREHGLSEEEYRRAVDALGREPSLPELGVISVMWSEHCSYKSSRKHLKGLPTSAPWVLQGPGENAGVIEAGDGLAVCFKIESHNHPSFIEPYQGAATGVGGILRDVFTMGARPIANMNALRFGDLRLPRMGFLVRGVVAGIGGYGNCMGVPTVGGEVGFDPRYNGNILVNAFTLGVMRRDRIFRSAASGPGNPVMYVGSKTGRDGIHGATMASESFEEDGASKRPRVQVGDPFTEKKLLEACLELMSKDAIIAIQDMGAAGLTSSSCEMAARGSLGIEMDIEKVPRREPGMTPYEVLLSESQERMLLVVRPGAEPEVRQIFEKWDLDAAVIGRITTGDRIVVREHGQVVVDLPLSVLVEQAPVYDRPQRAPKDLEARWTAPEVAAADESHRLLKLLSQPNIASKRWVYDQYDWSVRASTVVGPGAADAAVVRLPDLDLTPTNRTRRGVAMTVDVKPRWVGLDPYRGAALSVLEAATNLACVGAEARAVSDCLNFGNPEVPEVMWSFVEALRGMSDACRALETPIVSGNVSFYNETDGRAILPTPTVAMVGLVDDVTQVTSMAFQQEGHRIGLLGDLGSASLSGSELVQAEQGIQQGRPPEPSFERIKAVIRATITLVRTGLAQSAHDVSDGGLLVAIAECCIQSREGWGVRLQLPTERFIEQAFGEGPGLVVVSVAPEDWERARETAEGQGAAWTDLGVVAGRKIVVEGQVSVGVEEARRFWSTGLECALGEQSAVASIEAH
jgi:phosphoribosylformylglycinamidine synthase subunit PurL